MKNRKDLQFLIIASMILVVLGVTYLYASAPNKYTLVHYYGWFSGNWYVNGGAGTTAPGLQNISPSNQCGSSIGTHNHSASVPNDIAAVYYPVKGKYLSSDLTLLSAHRGYITTAGIKAAILSYAQGEGQQPNLSLIQTIATQLYTSSSIRIAFAIRNYQSPIWRNWKTVKKDIEDLLTYTAGKQYKVKFNTYVDDSDSYRAVFYIFAPNIPRGGCGEEEVDWGDWGCIFRADERSIWQPEPFIVLGQNAATATNVTANGFDGGYDYSPPTFHTPTFYSDKSNDAWATENNWMYSAGVAPGYNARRSKNDNCRPRTPNGAGSYNQELVNARSAQPHFINVISFNEWNEGTQIEPAQTNSQGWSGFYVKQAPPCSSPPDCGYQYIGYYGTTQYPTGPNVYLNVTRNTVGDSSLWAPRIAFPILNN